MLFICITQKIVAKVCTLHIEGTEFFAILKMFFIIKVNQSL